jgi:hypothetical protein
MAVLLPQKKALFIGKTKRGKGTKIMAIAEACGLSFAAGIQSALPHEIKLDEAAIKSLFAKKAPQLIISDKAYVSNPLENRLLITHGTDLI